MTLAHGKRALMAVESVDPALGKLLRHRLAPALARSGWRLAGRGASLHLERTVWSSRQAVERLRMVSGTGRAAGRFAVWMENEDGSNTIERQALAPLLPGWRNWLPLVGRLLRPNDFPWTSDAAGVESCLLDLESLAKPWFRTRNPPNQPILPRARLPQIGRTPYGAWRTRTSATRERTNAEPQWRQAGSFPVHGGGLLIGD